MVLAVDREERHVSLSLKRLLPNPWAYVEEKYAPNQVVEATVTHVVDFGIFVQLEEGLEGLVHISEINDEHIANLHQFVSPGDRVQVRILHIDAPKHRLSLSMREPPASPEDE
ncbi:MAG: 30S ribosomal protein S1 [Chloroflexi bacterium]|nr:30S ribosomal protein S1 [Chloroflexota bacterium]